MVDGAPWSNIPGALIERGGEGAEKLRKQEKFHHKYQRELRALAKDR